MNIYQDKVVDRQVGRNAELFARVVAGLEPKEKRHPYVRILISIVEQAHPEWAQAAQKERQIGHLIHSMSKGEISNEEVAEAIRARDAER